MSALFDYVDQAAPRQLALLDQLVSIDSGSDDKAGVDRVAAVLRPRLDALGLAVDTETQATVGDNLIGRKPGTSGRDVLLVGHMDTVFSAGTVAVRPFRIENGRAYGPGVYDMKGGLTVLLFALEALKESAPDVWSALGVRVVFNSDEEIGSGTSHQIIAAEAQRSAAALIFEPARPGGEYVRERKGSGNFTLRVEGKASHAGTQPELGASAIADLAHKIVALHALTDFSTGLTVNVGVVRGGERRNVVAPSAECQIDVRVTTGAMLAEAEAALRAIADRVDVPGTRATISGDFAHGPMEFTEGSRRLFSILEHAAADVGYEVRHVATGGASDGNTTAQYVPTLDGCGPRGNFAHSPDEFVEIASLPERTKAIARFLQLWLAHSP